MYYKIYGVDEEENKNPEDFDLNLEDGVFDATDVSSYNRRPVPKRTAPLPRERVKSSGNIVSKFIKLVVFLAVLLIAGEFVTKFVSENELDFSGTTDATKCVTMTAEEVEAALKITLTPDSGMYKQINHYTDSTVTVSGNGNIGVIYFGEQQAGLHINSKRYTLYGIRIGDNEADVERKMTYQYDEACFVINDMAAGYSTATFYYNRVSGDCFAVIINDTSKKVAAITYFNDYRKALENLSGIY